MVVAYNIGTASRNYRFRLGAYNVILVLVLNKLPNP